MKEYDEDDDATIPLEDSYFNKRRIFDDQCFLTSPVLNFLTSKIRIKKQMDDYQIKKNVEDSLKDMIKKITVENMDEIYN